MTTAVWTVDRAAAIEALERIQGARLVLLPTHQNVDADGLAAPLALMHAFDQLGTEAIPLVSDGDLPRNLRFLPGIERVQCYSQAPLPSYDLLCLADCSDRRRLGGFYADDPSRLGGTIPIINIDHHVTNDRFGQINIVEPDAASACELVTELLDVWGIILTQDLAQCLLAGIYGDTLGLRTSATTSRTMRTAANLVDAGANAVPIVDELFRLKSRSTVCIWEHALRNVQWTGSLIWTELTEETFRECGGNPTEAEGLVNFLTGTEGSRAAAILYANAQGWRVSLRSIPDDVDVAAIAWVFGGGGHPKAAGCQITGGEAEKQDFLERVAELAAGPVTGT